MKFVERKIKNEIRLDVIYIENKKEIYFTKPAINLEQPIE